jgi:hypothetical protein
MKDMSSSEEMFGDSVYVSGDAVNDTEEFDPVEDLTGDDPDEADQTGYSPPDREPHNLRDAPTPAEERAGESLDAKLAEEEPDVSPDDVSFTEPDPRAGRLVAPDEGWRQDVNNDELAEDVGPAGYASSAEEAAVHIVEEENGVD